MNTKLMREFCQDYFERYLKVPAFGMAIVEQESAFDTWAQATDPRDLARGGSRGLVQMSLKTAQSLGFAQDADQLFFPSVNLDLFLKLCAANEPRLPAAIRATPGSEEWVKGMAMLHNAGRYLTNPNDEVRKYAQSVFNRYTKWSTLMGTKIP